MVNSKTRISSINWQRPVSGLASILVALALSACATTPGSQGSSARVDIQESVGFTITEEERVSHDVRLDYQQALELLRRGELEEGIDAMQRVVAEAPALSAPHIDLGVAYHLAGNLPAAEQALLVALATNPDHPIAHNELGIVYRKTGRFAEARQSYEAALNIYPGFHYARRNLAVLCDLYLADTGCALENYEAYMATVISDEEVSMWMTDLRYRMEQGGQP